MATVSVAGRKAPPSRRRQPRPAPGLGCEEIDNALFADVVRARATVSVAGRKAPPSRRRQPRPAPGRAAAVAHHSDWARATAVAHHSNRV